MKGNTRRLQIALAAVLLAEIAYSAPPAQFTVLSRKADAARAANQNAEAIDLYRRALKLNPTAREDWWYLGTLLYDDDQYAEAKEALTKFVQLETDKGPGWALLGLCEFETRDYDRALMHLERALTLGLAGTGQIADVARFHDALLLTRAGEFEKSLSRYLTMVRAGDESVKLVEGLGLAALRTPLLPAETPPDEREMILTAGRAMVEAMARRPQTAEHAFEDLLIRYPDTPNVHLLYGSYLLANNPDQAIAQLRKELAVAPNSGPALVMLALEYLKRSDYEAGLPLALKATEIAPKWFAAQNVYGRLLVETGDVKRGIEHLELATQLEPTSPQNHVALATAYARSGRQEDAKRERETFLRLRKELDKRGIQ